ncbi:MAG: FAD/NAD(P)-binding oxidoreductase [Gammaproteobacteria bacterium]
MTVHPDLPEEWHEIVVVGGGAAGIGVAAGLLRDGARDVLVVEPAEMHYYQPLWTLVGGGIVPREASAKPMGEVIPPLARWFKDAVTAFEPERDAIVTASGRRVGYDWLVVAPGIQIDWSRIEGLPAALETPEVVSNYGYDYAPRTWEAIRDFRGGEAVFTFPPPPIKCAGAPQKILYLAEHWCRKQGLRERSRFHYYCATPTIFSSPHYAEALMTNVIGPRGIETHFKHELVAVRTASREAVFRDLEHQREVVQHYDLLHVAPPMSAPDFVKSSPLASAAGWVDVDKESLRHLRYPNVFGIGDASSLPTSKTAAAIRAQLPVLLANLDAARIGRTLDARYDGYTSCPLVTGYGSLILAEFGYDLAPQETFPFDQSKERRSMYLLKKHVLPQIYWKGLLRGAQWPTLAQTTID